MTVIITQSPGTHGSSHLLFSATNAQSEFPVRRFVKVQLTIKPSRGPGSEYEISISL